MTRPFFVPLSAPVLLGCALLGFWACSSDQKPSSLVDGSGGSSTASAGHGGKSGADAGSSNASAGEDNNGGAAGVLGSGGEGGIVAEPVAVFPSSLEADVGCNLETPSATLAIQNSGDEPLEIEKASVSDGYTLNTDLPLTIAAGASGTLSITPPAASSTADAGAVSTGTLTFTTNEPGTPTHEVMLNSATFEGRFEFTDSDGNPITSLTLVYDSGGACPGLTKFRIHNLGNATFSVLGPSYPSHFSGTTLGKNGTAILPDAYAEMIVGADSGSDSACEGAGDLAFTVMGTFCGAVPKLHVTWPVSTDPDAGTTSCSCKVPSL